MPETTELEITASGWTDKAELKEGYGGDYFQMIDFRITKNGCKGVFEMVKDMGTNPVNRSPHTWEEGFDS